MTTLKLSEVLRKIDLLDGEQNGKYMNQAIGEISSPGIVSCLFLEGVEQETNAQVPVFKAYPDGSLAEFDCKAVTRRLDLLANIAGKTQAVRFLDKITRLKSIDDIVPTPENMFAFSVIDFFILQLLINDESQKESLPEAFARLPIDSLVSSVHDLGNDFGELGLPETKKAYETFKIDGGVAGAYIVFAAEARKSGFDATPFKPASAESPSKAPPKKPVPLGTMQI